MHIPGAGGWRYAGKHVRFVPVPKMSPEHLSIPDADKAVRVFLLKIVLLALLKDEQVLMLLDWRLQRILSVRQMLHSLVFKIKDADFLPGSTRKFVTAGVQHMCFWTLNGTSLEYHVGELTIVKAVNNAGGGQVAVNANQNVAKYGLALVTDEL